MSGRNRQLTPEEAALWQRVAQTVAPIHPARRRLEPAAPAALAARPVVRTVPPTRAVRAAHGDAPAPAPDRRTLDAGWDRRLARGLVTPDFTLDLHGCTLDQAHARLDHGLQLATHQGARLVLLVTGRARPDNDHASRGDRRGAIRAKVIDWLAAGPHGGRIAAVRGAHPRHGGAGALYLVLRRNR